MRKFKITANEEQLEAIGLDKDIIGLEGCLINIFPDGWYELSVKYRCNITKTDMFNHFDFPPDLIEEIYND